jgi:Ni/Fe-hydrogenase subunit HybB-like protein
MKKPIGKITFWKVAAGLIFASGLYATYVRFLDGLGASTNLSDEFPWGLWVGFDVITGVGLAAGGFTIASMVYIFNLKRFEPIVRPAILTAFLGYLLVIVGLMYDLGRPLQIWHAIIMWNPRSVMFEVAWCVMLYTTVLALEFSPIVFERLQFNKAYKAIKRVTIPVVILGVLLSTLHQSSLGSIYLIVPDKLHPLWYSPYLPLFFYISAIGVGCAMVIIESFLSSRAFHRGLEMELLTQLGKFSVVMLGVYWTLKVVDLLERNAISHLFAFQYETGLYWLEMVIGVIVPILLLSRRKIRENYDGLFAGAFLMVVGFVLNRMNTTITGFETWAGTKYFPSWMEISVTLSIVAFGFVAFALAAKYLPIFTHAEHVVSSPADEFKNDLKLVSQVQ